MFPFRVNKRCVESVRQNRFKVSHAILFMDLRAIGFSKTTTTTREACVHVGNSVSPSLPNEPCRVIESSVDKAIIRSNVENSFDIRKNANPIPLISNMENNLTFAETNSRETYSFSHLVRNDNSAVTIIIITFFV